MAHGIIPCPPRQLTALTLTIARWMTQAYLSRLVARRMMGMTFWARFQPPTAPLYNKQMIKAPPLSFVSQIACKPFMIWQRPRWHRQAHIRLRSQAQLAKQAPKMRLRVSYLAMGNAMQAAAITIITLARLFLWHARQIKLR